MTLIAACFFASYSRASIYADNKEPFTIKPGSNGEIVWLINASIHHTQLQYKGSKMSAYYKEPVDFIGFGKKLPTVELPALIKEKIAKRLHSRRIENVMLFINAKGQVYYYAGVMVADKLVAVKVSSKCRLNILQKINLN